MRQYPSLTFIRGRFPGAAHHAVVRCRPGIHWGGRRSADFKTVIAKTPSTSLRAKRSNPCRKEERNGLLRGACHRAALCADPLARNDEKHRPLWWLCPHDGVMVSLTAATNWLSVNGFGRNANCWFSGRLFSKASSASPETKMILRSGLR